MSLVAYEYSSDEESEEAGESSSNPTITTNGKPNPPDPISDEEELPSGSTSSLMFNLPAPSKDTKTVLEEEDDEFLRIKATPTQKPPPKRGPVRISIPSLSQFKDLEGSEAEAKEKKAQRSKGNDLLSLLPKPLSETVFQTKTADGVKKRSLVPDSVINRQARQKKVAAVVENDDSDGSDTGDDFFRLNTTDELPTVSKNEISVLVAKKAAQIAATSSRFEQEVAVEEEMEDPEEAEEAVIDDEAFEKLCGGSKRAKRARLEEMNVMEIRGDEVMPSQEEWMRHALANSTEMPKNKPAAGVEATGISKRKHQITYLAYQAKANEQELQAMWAANRQSRRQTQSKYGF
uniref:Putative mitotic checkpoint protein prcc n=1 Tax=Phlebotomus kandelakii TaxID=1109342 RepID=A0A6B2EG23_9DIPT